MDREERFHEDGSNGWGFQIVPPPSAAPHHDGSEELGILPCLRANRDDRGGWRCSHCREMQKPGTYLVWVPDNTHISESAESITEASRQGAYNGHSSGWCLSCARKLGRKSLASGDGGSGVAAGFLLGAIMLVVVWLVAVAAHA